MRIKTIKRFLKNPLKAYVDSIRSSIIPKPYSHQVKMTISIKKGQQKGTALIPCTIYAMNHSIDLNPALIRRKDKKIMKVYKPGEKIKYNQNDYVVELTEDEKEKGYVLKELERCNSCGQKLVIAEVQATRYRSCPSIEVKLGDKAKEDVIVPVQFGINKSDITTRVVLTTLLPVVVIIPTLGLFGIEAIPAITLSALLPELVTRTIFGAILLGFLTLWLYFIPKNIYGTYKMLQWYNQVKSGMTKTHYKR